MTTTPYDLLEAIELLLSLSHHKAAVDMCLEDVTGDNTLTVNEVQDDPHGPILFVTLSDGSRFRVLFDRA